MAPPVTVNICTEDADCVADINLGKRTIKVSNGSLEIEICTADGDVQKQTLTSKDKAWKIPKNANIGKMVAKQGRMTTSF